MELAASPAIHNVHTRLDAGAAPWFAGAMKALSVVLVFLLGAIASATAADYTSGNRPVVVFKGGIVHQSPYPQSSRQASVWGSDACWRDCKSACNWKMEYCVTANAADTCRPSLEACDRSCQRDCRGITGGPFLGFVDF